MALEVLSIVITPANDLGKYLVRKFKTELHYVTEYYSNFSKFEEELGQLQARRDDVQGDVETARRELKEPRKQVLNWVESVENLEKECMPLTTNNTTDNKCLMGLLCLRRRTSKQLLKLTKDISSLLEKGRFTDIADLPPSLDVVPMGPRGTVENIPSRKLNMKEVMEALEDDNIRSIGVHGMGGIGKTTLVTRINNELCENRRFKKVIMVTVSKDPDMKIIQKLIAERLDLKLEKEDMPTRANALFEKLRSEGLVLLILDDVWKPIELGKLGLGHGIEHMPCKLIVTTRNADVLRGMDVQKVIRMKVLDDEEAWTLFAAKAGNVVEMPSLEPIAREIVRRCKGSPLAITTLGSTLREEKEEPIWAHALQVLEEPNAMGLDDIMSEVVTSLKWSYDHLKKKPNVQLCFLYCCLFPEDYNIRLTDLRNYGIGEGFLNMTSSLKEAQNELLSYIKLLKDCCLLLDGDVACSVKMHDVVRDVAICIASNDEDGFLVNVGGGSKYLPESDKLHTYKIISYMNNRDCVFPDALECPRLRSLLVRDSDLETNYSFEGVKSLRVLHMSWQRTRLSVPESISQLRNLRTLYLDGCKLWDETSLLGGLTKLEVLSLRDSGIGELPVEFGNLINLKFLDLTDARIHFMAPNVFSKFKKMEELLIARSITRWGTTCKLEDDEDDCCWCIADDGSRRNAAELKEVLSLPRLSVLDININRTLLDGEVLNYQSLQNFRIYVNYDDNVKNEFRCDMNELVIGDTDLGKHRIRNLIAVSNKSMDLSLRYCGGFKSVTDLDPAGSFNHLQNLFLFECNDVESVIVADRSPITAQDSFEKLETLHLYRMDRMERIFHGATSSTKFFGKLEVLVVYQCSKICTILPANLLFTENRLENLKEVRVDRCDEVQHIFNTEDNEFGATPATTALLSGVTDIDLFALPKLKSIWKGIMPEGSFQGLTHLSVEGCDSLKHLLPSDVAGFLQNLEEIVIVDCPAMETIIFPTREEAEETSLFPRCRFLTVASCPKLKSVFSFGIANEETSLLPRCRLLTVDSCSNLKSLFSFGVARHVHLEEIKIKDCEAMETIIFPTREEAEGTSLLPMCRLLTVDSCPKLKCVFSFGIARHLHKLNKLSISHCHGLRQIFGNGDEPRVTEHRCLLPELNYLELVDLRSLTRFDQDNLPISGPLEEIKVFVCPNLTRLPLQTVSALKFIHAEDIWFRNLELEDESQASILKPYFQATPVPSYKINEKLHSLLWKVAGLWLDDYDSQLEGTTQFRRLLSSGCLDNMPISDVRKSGVVPCLVEFLTREDHTQLQSEAVWVLANIASRSSRHTKLVIAHGALPIFVNLLCSPNEDIREHAIWALGKIARYSPKHRDLVLRHTAYLQGHDKSEIQQKAVDILKSFQLANPTSKCKQIDLNNPPLLPYVRDSWSNASAEQYTFNVGSGTNNKKPLLRPKPTRKKASKIGLVKKEKHIIVRKDYGMTGADDSSCMTSLGNAKIDLKYPPSTSIEIVKYPPSSSIEIAKERHVDQMPDDEPYLKDNKSNTYVKIDDNSLQSSSSKLAKQSHVT